MPINLPAAEDVQKYRLETGCSLGYAQKQLTFKAVLEFAEKAATLDELKEVIMWLLVGKIAREH